jgi:hypothetical protein
MSTSRARASNAPARAASSGTGSVDPVLTSLPGVPI